jgi:hypothetical protein
MKNSPLGLKLGMLWRRLEKGSGVRIMLFVGSFSGHRSGQPRQRSKLLRMYYVYARATLADAIARSVADGMSQLECLLSGSTVNCRPVASHSNQRLPTWAKSNAFPSFMPIRS